MIYGVVLGVHVLVCLGLVLVVLLQSSKGGGLAGGSAFGGGAESTVFGGRGAATVLSKATTFFGAMFMITSLTLTLMSGARSTQPRSVVQEAAQAPIGGPTPSAPPTATLPPLPEQGASPGPAAPPPTEEEGAGTAAGSKESAGEE